MFLNRDKVYLITEKKTGEKKMYFFKFNKWLYADKEYIYNQNLFSESHCVDNEDFLPDSKILYYEIEEYDKNVLSRVIRAVKFVEKNFTHSSNLTFKENLRLKEDYIKYFAEHYQNPYSDILNGEAPDSIKISMLANRDKIYANIGGLDETISKMNKELESL